MKRFLSGLLAVVLITGCSFLALAKEKAAASKAAKPGGVVVDVIQLSGKVTAVDYQKRTVTIEGFQGRSATFNAKHARNLDQVKVGDVVKADYIEEVALFVRKADAPPSVSEGQAVELAPKGSMPGGLVVETLEIKAAVEDVNTRKRTITVKGVDGKARTFKADKSVKNFKEIKKGDQVVLRVTEAFALSVARP